MEENETIVSFELNEEYSPYQFAKVWSLAVGRAIRPQMAYNYVKNNLIPAHRNSLGHLVIVKVDAEAFLVKQMQKVQNKQASVELELAGA